MQEKDKEPTPDPEHSLAKYMLTSDPADLTKFGEECHKYLEEKYGKAWLSDTMRQLELMNKQLPSVIPKMNEAIERFHRKYNIKPDKKSD